MGAKFVLPCLNICFFFANFVPADIGRVSRLNDTVLTPPAFAFLIWLIIYIALFAFVCYQLCSKRVRESGLIQKHISLLWIFHQILVAAWLLVTDRDHIYTSTILMHLIFFISLAIFSIITHNFRNGIFEAYSVKDFIFVECPFALLLGWETVACVSTYGMLAVKLQRDGIISQESGVIAQVAAFIAAVAAISVAAVLYAGLPRLMNPLLHIPLMWACWTIGWRWHLGKHPQSLLSASELNEWATEPILRGIGTGAWILGVVVLVFFAVTTAIFVRTEICLGPLEEEEEEEYGEEAASQGRYETSNYSTNQRRKNDKNSPFLSHETGAARSPRTARSAPSGENAV